MFEPVFNVLIVIMSETILEIFANIPMPLFLVTLKILFGFDCVNSIEFKYVECLLIVGCSVCF